MSLSLVQTFRHAEAPHLKSLLDATKGRTNGPIRKQGTDLLFYYPDLTSYLISKAEDFQALSDDFNFQLRNACTVLSKS